MTVKHNRQPAARQPYGIEPTGRAISRRTDSQDVVLTYNMFRHKDEAGLYCAVPQDRPVPAFLTEDKWDYARSPDIRALSGFDDVAAGTAARANGFYLFHAKA